MASEIIRIEKEPTKSQKIWERIKDIDLELYSLPDQPLIKHAKPIFELNKEELYLLLSSPAVLPMLEYKLAGVKVAKNEFFTIEVRTKFAVVTLHTKS